MDKVKIAVIGVGGIGGSHLACIDRAENAQLVAVCDIKTDRADEVAAKWGVDAYYTHEELLAKADVDAITIGTPHYDHTPIAIHGLDAGKHVLTEKPIAVHVNDAQKMVDAAERNPDRVFSAMFQLRMNPMWQRAKKLIDDGELGPITRVNWTATNWFRSQAYYNSGGWRATWSGEGGGVLLNQCPHNLDILQWLTGLPERVSAHVAIGKDHHIEVEDEVIAILHYPGGAVGTFITNTREAPGVDRMEIAGDRGVLIVEHGKLTFRRTVISVKEHLQTTETRFGIPEVWEIAVPTAGENLGHYGIMQNFLDTIQGGGPLVAPAVEGIRSVSLGNAMLMSGLKKKDVTLPLDGDEYEAMLKQLIEKSTFKKKDVNEAGDLSLKGSF